MYMQFGVCCIIHAFEMIRTRYIIYIVILLFPSEKNVQTDFPGRGRKRDRL